MGSDRLRGDSRRDVDRLADLRRERGLDRRCRANLLRVRLNDRGGADADVAVLGVDRRR